MGRDFAFFGAHSRLAVVALVCLSLGMGCGPTSPDDTASESPDAPSLSQPTATAAPSPTGFTATPTPAAPTATRVPSPNPTPSSSPVGTSIATPMSTGTPSQGVTPTAVPLRCLDEDGDGLNGFDAQSCPSGSDLCDGDWDNWTSIGCSSCGDTDGDGFGESCDRGMDCWEGDAAHHARPQSAAGLAQMITAFDLSAERYTYDYLACHDLIAVDFANFVPGAASQLLDVSRLKALNPEIHIFIYVNLMGLWDSAATAMANPAYGAWWETLPPNFRMKNTSGQDMLIWPSNPSSGNQLYWMDLMNVTSNVRVGGDTYLDSAADYLLETVIPGVGGLDAVDGIFLDNAWGSETGLSFVNDWCGCGPMDSDLDGQPDSDDEIDEDYKSAIRGYYRQLKDRTGQRIKLIGNHPAPNDLDLLDGRYGETNGGACSLNSQTCAMDNVLSTFNESLSGVPFSIINLSDRYHSPGMPAFTSMDAVAYSLLFAGAVYVDYDDGTLHNTPIDIPIEYALFDDFRAPSGPVERDGNVYIRQYPQGRAIVNGYSAEVGVSFDSGQTLRLGPGKGLVTRDTSRLELDVPTCTYALSMSNGARILQLETDAVCGVWTCGDGWWSSNTDGEGEVPQEIVTLPGSGPLRFNVLYDNGDGGAWASDTATSPKLGSAKLTNIQSNPDPVGGTYFVFKVGNGCEILNEGE